MKKENKKVFIRVGKRQAIGNFFNKNLILIFLSSFLFLYLSRNILINNNLVSMTLLVLSILCLLTPILALAFLKQVWEYFPKNLRRFLWVILSLGGASFCLYIFQSDLVWPKIFHPSSSAELQLTIEGWHKFLEIAYLVLFASTFVLAVMFQSSLKAALSEERKMIQAKTIGINIVILFAILLSLNYIAKLRPFSIDMTALRKYDLSPEGKELIKGIDKKIIITAFYPFFHELYRELELILNHVRTTNPLIEFSIIDAIREKDIADAKKIDDYGYILVESIDPNELDMRKREKQRKIRVTKKKDLKKIEKELIEAMLAVSNEKKNLYFTSGHEETPDQGPFKNQLSTVFRNELESQNYKIKNLSTQEGFPPEVPKDTDALIIIGPKRSFVLSEQKAILDYISRGGKIFLALDPKHQTDFSFLLDPFDLIYQPKEVLSDMSAKGRPNYLITNHYSSSSPITAPFQDLPANQKFSILQGVGFFEQKLSENSTPKAEKSHEIDFFLKSGINSWVDQIPNQINDQNELKKARNLAASIALDQKKPAPDKKPVNPDKPNSENSFRLIFFGDADFLKNEFILWPGNQYKISINSVKWLLEDEKIMGILPKKIETGRVNLTTTQDDLVFYSLVFIWPFFILVGGFFHIHRDRSKRAK